VDLVVSFEISKIKQERALEEKWNGAKISIENQIIKYL
jgi:hypothetical protein